ncbi:hypothetical protein J010_01130 [Cryptococcus neoformans]|nr:hypothetical protein C355_01221 [Cryptococcus neoformans var. grubii Th84]OXH16863.1 hypothetical protein J010_01130 [Cryptococcus neoformans var. grubii]OXH36834.1 hypothetical protein J009_01141 [Cryptococcus neoformans var. grubii]OXH57970.1 hypothetical protein J003_01148 [Cryptococcus neoformans var. grubii]OXH58193.1 hypothetical protein J004_01183 [Cryptococcus neoformans var. grubii]
MLSSLRMAQIVGVSGAMWLSGNIVTLSLISIPALQRSALEDAFQPLRLQRKAPDFRGWKGTEPTRGRRSRVCLCISGVVSSLGKCFP